MHSYSWSRPAFGGGTESSRIITSVFGLSDDRFTAVPVLEDVIVPSTGITYVTGYSGAGKSKLLELFRSQHPEAHVPSGPADPADDRPLVELFDMPLQKTLSLLGQVGLGEAFTYLTPYNRLSDGQRARARLALAYSESRRLLVIDEFLSTLDRESARIAAYGFQRFCRRNGVSAVVATAHDDLVGALGPDLLIKLDYNGEKNVVQQPCLAAIPFEETVRIRPGSLADYEELARFHYMGGLDVPPDAFDIRVHVAEVSGKVAGVKVLSSPYPNAWQRFREFREVNEALTISRRTVVHPVFRSIGLAHRLCDPRLASRDHVYIRSALGRFQPFPLSAGYRSVEVADNRETELSAAVAELAVSVEAAGGPGKWPGDRAKATTLLRERGVELLVGEYVQYRELGGLMPLAHAELSRVRRWFTRCNDALSFEQLWEAARPFLMAGFIAGRETTGDAAAAGSTAMGREAGVSP
ncbi:hypothetical protein AB0C52_07060 [Streptomyces sp. NPDC048717]|uniref:hypothetical protein n=1 Tax=Streptomyces sp. NPDC048717 TaxID=3154928 RepID=UPI00342F2B25